MGVQPATVQPILRHSSITVTTSTYVEVIEAVQRDALDSMSTLFATHGRRLGTPIVVKTVVKRPWVACWDSESSLVELRGLEPLFDQAK